MKKLITICLMMAATFTTQAQKKDYSYKQDKAYFLFAPEILPSFFSGGDIQLAFRLVKNTYVGGEFRVGDIPDAGSDGSFGKMSYGGFFAYKVPLNNNFSIWASGGYYNTTTKDYKISTPVDQGPPYYSTSYPSTSELSIKWAIGVNFVAGNGIGITIFTPEAKALMIGMVIGH